MDFLIYIGRLVCLVLSGLYLSVETCFCFQGMSKTFFGLVKRPIEALLVVDTSSILSSCLWLGGEGQTAHLFFYTHN
jgi:hypothetical protein